MTEFKGRPLVAGEKIPGTALTFVAPVLRRRGEFQCDCGRRLAFNLSAIERGDRKSCGHGCHKRKEI